MGRGVRAVVRIGMAMTGIGALVILLVLILIPRMTGGAALTVLSGSMSPTYPAGSIVLVLPVDPQTVRPGDVITFQTAPGVAQFVTHRVVRVQHDTTPMSFITKGDANRGEDSEPVPIGAVRGTVRMHVPYLGTIAQHVRTPLGMALLLLIPAGWFLISQARSIVGEVRRGRSEGKPDEVNGFDREARTPVEV
jgi:signal peptidase I